MKILSTTFFLLLFVFNTKADIMQEAMQSIYLSVVEGTTNTSLNKFKPFSREIDFSGLNKKQLKILKKQFEIHLRKTAEKASDNFMDITYILRKAYEKSLNKNAASFSEIIEEIVKKSSAKGDDELSSLLISVIKKSEFDSPYKIKYKFLKDSFQQIFEIDNLKVADINLGEFNNYYEYALARINSQFNIDSLPQSESGLKKVNRFLSLDSIKNTNIKTNIQNLGLTLKIIPDSIYPLTKAINYPRLMFLHLLETVDNNIGRNTSIRHYHSYFKHIWEDTNFNYNSSSERFRYLISVEKYADFDGKKLLRIPKETTKIIKWLIL